MITGPHGSWDARISRLSNTLEIAGVPDDSGGAAYGFHLLPPADIAFPDSGSRCIQTNM